MDIKLKHNAGFLIAFNFLYFTKIMFADLLKEY